MIVTRAQLESLSQDELIDRLLSVENISERMTNLINRFDKLMNKYEELHSELVVSKIVNKLLKNRVIQLEKNALNTSQYIRREIIEINPVPTSVPDNVLEKNVCDALSLTGILVKQEDLHACHRMKDQSKVIIKFKDRKQKYRVIHNRKKLANNEDVKSLGFGNELYISESMCIENQQLFYRCRRLKALKKIHLCWFFNQC